MKALRIAAIPLLALALLGALLFLPAGRIDWLRGWLFLGLQTFAGAALSFLLLRRDPELFRRRLHTGVGTPLWDRAMVHLLRLGITAEMLVGALDAGPAGQAELGLALWPLGALLCLGGYALFTWCMLVNTHFESHVRIQRDRAHRVVPHPGYIGFLLLFASIPLLLGSTWAFAPCAFVLAVLVLRTTLEDRLLRRELAGYAEYAKRVRYRLLPGIW